MHIEFHLDYNNDKATPLTIAQALIDNEALTDYDIHELAEHLRDYCDSLSRKERNRY